MTTREVADLFADLELRLIASLKRNLARHRQQEQDEGGKGDVPENWPMWQAEKLRSLRRFRRENKSIMGEYTDQIDTETRALMREQFAEADGSDGAFFGINGRKLNALIEEMTHNEAKVEKAALRYMDDVYRKTILRAASSMAAGGMTLQQATDLAVKDFLAQGINCVRYRNGRQVNIATYAEMALRTNSTRAMLLGEAQQREALGIDTVLVSQYGACSDTCLPWQGRVYIDDVWQPYHGAYTPGGTYGVSRNGRQYPLLSVAVKAGLFHPNCRHHLTTWIEGISERPEPMDKAECERVSRLEKKQRYLETQVRRWKRMAEGTQNPTEAADYRRKARAAQGRVKSFVDAHSDVLRRDYWREREDTGQIQVLAGTRGSGTGAVQPGESVRKVLGMIDPKDTAVVQRLTDAFCKKYAASPVEYMMVITKNGEVHLMTDNNPKSVDSSYLGDKLKGSYNIHTHPPDSTQYSFSTDVDIPAAFADGTAVMEAVDYKYRYLFEVPRGITAEQWEQARAEIQPQLPQFVALAGYSADEYEDVVQHVLMKSICNKLGIEAYRRWHL